VFPADFIPPFLAAQDEPPIASEPDEVEPESALLAAPLEPCATAPVPTKKERGVMAAIRAMWVWVLGLLAAMATFAVDAVTSLNLPVWAVFGITMFCTGILYAAKRFTWPDTKF
jgi:hypothetical protein